MICKCQRLRKFVKESFCPCVCVRLKNAPDFSVRVVLCGRKSCLDLRRMVCVIIDDRDTVECSFVFKAAVSTGKGQESLFDLLKVDAKQCSGNDCGKCIGYIVLSVDREENTIFLCSVIDQVERNIPHVIVLNILCSVICIVMNAICDDIAVQVGNNLLVL